MTTPDIHRCFDGESNGPCPAPRNLDNSRRIPIADTPALPPIPAAAGHAGIIGPHHLSVVGMFDSRFAIAGGVEGLLSGRAEEDRCTFILGEVLAAQRNPVQHRDGVVDIRQPVHPRQARGPQTCGEEAIRGCCGSGSASRRTPDRPPATTSPGKLCDRSLRQPSAGGNFRCLQQRLALGVTGTGNQPAR